jgi:cytochrome c peroxidase
MSTIKFFFAILLTVSVAFSCQRETGEYVPKEQNDPYVTIRAFFSKTINLDNLPNYANQEIPAYIRKDNFAGKKITNEKALLGRVLFYDKSLSVKKTVSCASCHQQEFAFSDQQILSKGENGLTARHSMRLVNARFSAESKFFWDKRAASLAMQTTMPIRDHSEMGFSGKDGAPSFDELLKRLSEIPYYPEFFKLAYGDSKITEERIQEALSNFVGSIQSFDSKYDAGRAQTPDDLTPFPNFTREENMGKNLFIGRPQFNPQGVRIGGGLGCVGCHQAPEFDIDPASLNNGVVKEASGADAFNITRSPSLRDVVKADGKTNGSLMHTGGFSDLNAVLQHYNSGIMQNRTTDPRLQPAGQAQRLNLTPQEAEAVIAFLKTLSGQNLYKDPKWSDPFAK